MNFKKIGTIAGGFLGSFLVVLVAMYFLYSYINPQQKESIETETTNMEETGFNPEKYSPKAVESLNKQVENLQQIIDSIKTVETDYINRIDSLQEHINQVEQDKEETTDKVPEAEMPENMEDVSRSLLNLDEDSLAPIVNLLDNEQLVGLYNSASNMQRAKLLRSLKPDKAATILKEVM